jgi:hypothetical protein
VVAFGRAYDHVAARRNLPDRRRPPAQRGQHLRLVGAKAVTPSDSRPPACRRWPGSYEVSLMSSFCRLPRGSKMTPSCSICPRSGPCTWRARRCRRRAPAASMFMANGEVATIEHLLLRSAEPICHLRRNMRTPPAAGDRSGGSDPPSATDQADPPLRRLRPST